ncbi:MAG: PEP-CTERM sorting domain-containing protein [Planctomycetota bacterium]
MNKLTLLLLATLLVLPTAARADLVVSWEFSTDGNAEGWTTNNVSSPSVAGGFFSGTASSNDPQLNQSGLNLDPNAGESWTTIVFSVQEIDETPANVPFNPVGIVVAINGGGAGGLLVTSGFTSNDLGGGFFEVTADISAFDMGTITSLRVDPIGGAASNSNSETSGNSFNVDYIRVSDSLIAVPEPTSLSLLGMIGVGLMVRRRKA